MNIISIIQNKKNRLALTKEEIEYFVNGYVKRNTITNYQAASLLMAINLIGLNEDETYYLTKAYLESGETIDFKETKGVIIDKHSTGGVGDKVSLILGPICAACGIKVAKISGKGLGHTGGTIDKLASIGVNTDLQIPECKKLLNSVGMFITSQTKNITPADKKIYALRNATCTVNSIPLIAASIVSKKLALATDFVFLDVKVGSGSFTKTLSEAIELSKLMMKLFKRFNRKAIIHITDMNQPLGTSVGNAIEVKEAINFLNGNFENQHLKQLIFDFMIDILTATGKAKTRSQAEKKVNEVIRNKSAIKAFIDWAVAQGASRKPLQNNNFFKPKYQYEIKATSSGYLKYNSTKEIGLISLALGAGRLKKAGKIDYQAGILLSKPTNAKVEKNETVAILYSSKPIKVEAINDFHKNMSISPKKEKDIPPVLKVIA